MKKIFLILCLFLCACDKIDNPECLKNVKEVQIVGIARETPPDIPVAVAKICTPKDTKDTEECTGDWVLIPDGLVPEIKNNMKITLPKHQCFVFADYYADFDENDVPRTTPILGFAPRKIKETNLEELFDNIAEQEYNDCLKYAAQEFKGTKRSANKKTCRCVIDYIYKDDTSCQEYPDRFSVDFRAILKKRCGNNIPSYTLRDFPEFEDSQE